MDYQQIKSTWERRRKKMQQLRALGQTFEQIAKRYKITRQRAQQIVAGK